MRLKCIVCGHTPEYTERFVKLESWLQGEGGSRQGVCMMVCPKHLPIEMLGALGLYQSGAFRDYTSQISQEQIVFKANK